MTIDHVAEQLDCSASKISRLETGQTGSSPRDVRDMLALYHVGEPELEDLMAVARETRQRGWWQPYGSVLTGAYIGFEAAAETIRAYEAQCVPGLLQIEDYARGLIGAAKQGAPASEIESKVRIRLTRQQLLTQDEPVTVTYVVDEAVLRRVVGGPTVMKRQLDHLVTTIAERSNVTVHVLPFEAGAHAGMQGSFVILSFPDQADTDTVYVTMATGGVFQEKADELVLYASIFDRLREAALPPEDSIAFIASLAKELT